MRKIECAVMTLLRRHNSEGQWSCVDEDHLKVVDIDDNGFVKVVKCINENCTKCNELMETTCHGVSWTYEKIYDPSLLKKGDHICWHRPYVIWHHAIVTKVGGEGIDFIHYSDNKTVKRGKMTSGGCIGNECNSLYRINYQDCYNNEYTVLRAKKLLGENRYNLIERNCEHFSRWCKTGSTNSSQISICWTSLGKVPVVLSMFLKAIGLLVVLGIIEYSSELREDVMDHQIQLNGDKNVTRLAGVQNEHGHKRRNIKDENLTKLEDVHVKLLAVYIVVMTVVFVVYLVKTSASRLRKVPIVSHEGRRDVPIDEGRVDEDHPDEVADEGESDKEESEEGCCHCTYTCIRSLLSFYCSIIRYLCCSVCNNVTCCPFTCCRRRGHLACGLFARIFVRELLAAAGTLAIMLNEAWITEGLGIKDFSPFARTSIVIVLALLANIVGYIIGAFIGRWAEAICHVCCRPCSSTSAIARHVVSTQSV